MKDGGKTIKPMEEEGLFMLTGTSSRVNGLTTKLTDLEFILT